MLFPLLIGAVFDFRTLEVPMNVTAALTSTRIAPPWVCNEKEANERKIRKVFKRRRKEMIRYVDSQKNKKDRKKISK